MKYKYIYFLLILFAACKSESNLNQTTQDVPKETNMEQLKPGIPAYIDSNYVMGKFDPAQHSKFELIDIKYADREGLYLHKESLKAFIGMWEKAKAEGFNFTIKSATRNFNYQKSIWDRKWTGETLLEGSINAKETYKSNYQRAIAIMRFSSMPGTSRHHWGTDIDLNAFTNEYFESGQGLAEYNWLLKNAESFGFVQVYTDKASTGRTGYEEEKWHWSYKPISSLCQDVAEKHILNSDISGFDGADAAEQIDVKQNYIFGIDKSCF